MSLTRGPPASAQTRTEPRTPPPPGPTLTRTRLLSAAGRGGDPLVALEEGVAPYLTPFEVVFAR